MSIQPDFAKAAYHINCVLNGLSHQWCDESVQDILTFERNLDALRADLLPYFEKENEPMARALRDALQAVADGKDDAIGIVSEGLHRIGQQVGEITPHIVSFQQYCDTLTYNRCRAFTDKPFRDPNLRHG